MNYCIRCPIGVAGLISPWNLPLYLLTFKIAPAIAAGNTVVCKPSEMTSVTAWMMAKLMNEAGKFITRCFSYKGGYPHCYYYCCQYPGRSFEGSYMYCHSLWYPVPGHICHSILPRRREQQNDVTLLLLFLNHPHLFKGGNLSLVLRHYCLFKSMVKLVPLLAF